MADHNSLIDSLSRDAASVKRPAMPAVRTGLWIATALPLGAMAVIWTGRVFSDWSAPGAIWALVELIAAFGLGIVAILSAFRLSIAGRKPVSWPWFAATGLTWLAMSVAGVFHARNPWGHLGSGSGCYIFMMTASLPMIVLAILSVRRTRTLYPVRTLGAAGLGIAAMTAVLLSLCHPPSGDLPDLVMHLLAAATIMAVTVMAGRRLVAV